MYLFIASCIRWRNKLAMTVDFFEYEPIRLNYTFYGEEKPKLECFDRTKGQLFETF